LSFVTKAKSGIKWTSISALFTTILQLIQLSVLARFLDPIDFGLMAILLIIMGFSYLFLDFGISNAIIQKKEVTPNQLSSLYWLNIFLGIIIFLIINSVASQIADFYRNQRLVELIRLVSLGFIIQPFGNQFQILLRKELNFRIIVKIEIISKTISFILSIILAINNFGVYALVYPYLLNIFLLTILYLFFGIRIHKPRFYFRKTDLKEFISFGLFQMGEKSINYFSAQIDKILIGKFLSIEVLGFYSLAWQIIIFPLSKINPIVTKVAFPLFSKIQKDKELINKFYLTAITLIMMINIPLMLGLFSVAYEFVTIYYGAHYLPSAKIIQILAFVGLLKSFGNPGGSVILAQGRADVGFYWNIFWSIMIAIFCLVFILVFNTIESVAYAQLFGAIFIGWYWHFIIAKVGKIIYKPILMKTLKIFIGGVVMVVVIFLMKLLTIESVLINLLLQILGGAITYLIFIYLFEKQILIFLSKKDQVLR